MSKFLFAQRAATVVILGLLANHFRPVYSLVKHAFLEPLPDSPLARESCTILKSPALKACEDLTTWHRSDGSESIIASCDPGRFEWNTVMGPVQNSTSSGALHLISGSQVEELKLDNLPTDFNFHPLGIAIWPESGQDRLFVVNHGREMSSVEVFDLTDAATASARWVTSLRGEERLGIIAPNSIVALSATSFYLTHDHWYTRRPITQQILPLILLPNWFYPIVPLINTIETYMLLRTGSITHNTFVVPPHPSLPNYMRSKPVVEGVPFANGLAISPDGSHALLASTSTSKVFLYAIDDTTETFKYVTGWNTPFHPDNIAWKSDPRNEKASIASIAGHRSSPAVSKIARSGSDRKDLQAPSFVSQISFPNHFDTLQPLELSRLPVETVYTNEGDFGTSTSAEFDSAGTLWVSGLYQDGILRCDGARAPQGARWNAEDQAAW